MNTKEALFYKINKEVYFNSVNFDDQTDLLKAVRQDLNRIEVWFNGERQKSYLKFLEKITNKFPDYIDKILAICNQNAHFSSYNKIFDIISKHDYHFSTINNESKEHETVKTVFNFQFVIKQGIITNTYKIFKVQGDAVMYKTIKISTIIDFCTADPVLVKIEYLD